MMSLRSLTAALLLAQRTLAANFTISNGQIFTPGFVVVDSPQPNTPLGGETLQVAIDVTANGKLPLPPYGGGDDPSQIFNITMFLYSYDTGRNFTISNGTETSRNASLGEIMALEPGSTVKHINWVWPDCLVGDGTPKKGDSDRGRYNISIRQNFRLNGEDHYTIFDLPISVTNSIEKNQNRSSCDSLSNELLSYDKIDAESANEIGVLFAPGDATKVESDDKSGAPSAKWSSSGLIPREGFCADVLVRLARQTALNPAFLLPLVLLSRLTKKGQDFSILHPLVSTRLKTLFWFSVARWLSDWVSDKVRNNWVDDEYNWSKEIVLVTGGAGGIGGRIVKLLEEKGVTVVVLDVQPMSFAVSSKVHYFKCDIRSPEKVEEVARDIRAQVGHPSIIINNAGVARGKTVLESTPGDIRFTFDVNSLALYWMAKAFLPNMVANNHGMVVTVSSYAAWLCIPNMVDYGASKAAALSFHEGLTAELTTRYNAPKVRTVAVHPGHTRTALFDGYDQKTDFMMPQLEPESVAEAVVKQVLTGRSGQVVIPGTGTILAALRALPDWYSVRLRAKAEAAMTNFRGRQVIEDVDASYRDQEESQVMSSGQHHDTGESTVLVSKE
ncbi:hypothetical protein BGZ63DRAFT_470134 [Mariannaea sp. PMI_226]|nr:hypothetical protein BGZ63DRAFT_470134 [Mariannaea sp. PMI_226]